eukprot:389663_1
MTAIKCLIFLSNSLHYRQKKIRMHSPSKSIVKHRGNLKEHCIKTDQKEDDEQRIEGYLRVYLMEQTLFQTTCLHHKKSIKQCRNTRQTRVIIIHFFFEISVC